VDCFFQNDQQEFLTSDYLKGIVRTTGIARFTNLFTLGAPQPYQTGYIFTLTPIADADYNFYVDFQGTICPLILYKIPSADGCILALDYNGTSEVRLGGTLLSFNSTDQTVQNIDYGTFEITVNNSSCLIITCEVINEITQVILTTPNFNLIPSDIQNVLGDLNLFDNINATINNVNSVIQQVTTANEQILNIGYALSLLNFNVTDQYNFENFTEIRDQVNLLLAELANAKGDAHETLDLTDCSSIFGSIACFFSDLLANIIYIAIVIAIVIVLYILIFKLKVCKACC